MTTAYFVTNAFCGNKRFIYNLIEPSVFAYTLYIYVEDLNVVIELLPAPIKWILKILRRSTDGIVLPTASNLLNMEPPLTLLKRA